MADKNINIAVILSAYDKMSAVFNTAINSATKKLSQLQAASDKISKASTQYGRDSMTTGLAAAAPLIAAAKAYADQEEAMLRMRAAMTQDGNVVNQKQLTDLTTFAQKTSEALTGSTTDYLNMVKVLQENGIKPDEILGGIGNSVAKLAVFFKMAPDSIAQFAARMKTDMGIMPKEMGGMMDLIARLNNAGVGKNGEEAVAEMGEAFSKAGLGAHNLGIQGLQASKDLGALMGIFIRRGISGQTVGNNFRRIFDGLRDAEKLKKANAVAKEYGITLDFYDKNHQFKGVANFTAELNKLKGLDTTQIAAVLKPFGGKQGLSTDFLEFLGKEGTSSFNEFQHKLSAQATLAAKVKLIMGGLSNSFERTKTTALNSAAAFASTYAPELKQLINNFNTLFTKVTAFINTHKTLVGAIAKGIAYFAAFKLITGGAAWVFGSFMGTIGTSIKVFGFLGRGLLLTGSFVGRMGMLLLTRGIPAMASFTATVWANAAAWLANPATYIILAIIAAVAALIAIGILVYKNWDKIIKWFSDKWTVMKAGVSGLISVFRLFLDVVVGVGKALVGAFTFNPKMIVEGAKQAASAVSKIANGGIGKAFVQGANSSLQASNVRINSNGDVVANTKPMAKVSGGGAVHNHFSPVIQLHGTAKPEDGKNLIDSMKPHLDKWYKDKKANEARLSYK